MPNYNLELNSFFEHYKKTKQPIETNFRELVKEISTLDRMTHFIHPYPAKLLQHIPYFFLNNNLLSEEQDTVLDPFCGTGTVLLESTLAGRKSIGIDVNPFATFVAKLKNTIIDIEQTKVTIDWFKQQKLAKRKSKYFKDFSQELGYWYEEKTLNELCLLKEIIEQIKDDTERDFFNLCFSISARKMSLTDPWVSVPVRINENKIADKKNKKHLLEHLQFVKKKKTLNVFIDIAERNIKRFKSFKEACDRPFQPDVQTILHNVQNIKRPDVKDESVQLIISSPPYVSAQKYIRASKISMKWLELDKIQSVKESDLKSIGREHFRKHEYADLKSTGIKSADAIIEKIRLINPLRAHIAYTYLIEMRNTVKFCFNTLKQNGYFVLIIGNNTICGYEFKTHEFLIQIAKEIGLNIELELIDAIKSRGLMTKRNKTANIISREHVIIFKKQEFKKG